MVEQVWLEISEHYPGVNVDTFVSMPNHIHGIIAIERDDRPTIVGATHKVPAGFLVCVAPTPERDAPTGTEISIFGIYHWFL